MSKLPYRFHTPIPRYFFETGWLNPKRPTYFNTLTFLYWSFKRCNNDPHTVCWDSKKLTLEPFEFICGRHTFAEEMGRTPDEFLTQVKNFINAGLLEKTPNSVRNRFNCYKWLVGRFSSNDTQQYPQQLLNSYPSHPHKRNEETNRSLDLKDDSSGVSGNVHMSSNSVLPLPSYCSLESHSESNIDIFKFASDFIFHDTSRINEQVLLRWLKKFEHLEIYKSLLYYKKMASTQTIVNPEAYVESCLSNRYWESDEMRSECREREAKHKKQKEDYSKDFT